MSQVFNTINIRKFLPETDEALRSLARYHRDKMRIRTQKDRTDLLYDNYEGSVPMAKADSMVEAHERREELPELVIDVADWWLHENNGSKEALQAARFHHELAFAAQSLWSPHREVAMEGFKLLAEVHPQFEEAWNPDNLAPVPALDPVRSLDEFVAHLANCEGIFSQLMGCIRHQYDQEAIDLFDRLEVLQPGYGSRPAALSRDLLLVGRALNTMMRAADTGFLYDRNLSAGSRYPYLLACEMQLPIDPASSMDDVTASLRELGPIDDEDRAALESLGRSEAERLFIDLFLYPGSIAPDVAHEINQEFTETGQMPEVAELIERYPQDAPLLLISLGWPAEALELWRTAQRDRPLDGRLAHSLALLSLSQALSSPASPADVVVGHWRRAIAQWAIAMSDTAYWVSWGRVRSQVYKRDFVFTPVLRLGDRVRSYLDETLSEQADLATKSGQTELADALAPLKQSLGIEFAAVSRVQSLGDIPLESGRLARFGPIGMVELDQEQALADYVARIQPSFIQPNPMLDKLSPGEALRRLRWLFSELGSIAYQVDLDPASVLDAFHPVTDETPCGHADCPRHGRKPLPVQIPCPYADDFGAANPAYQSLPNRNVQLIDDTLQLAIEAHLRFLHNQVSQGTATTVETFRASWQALLDLAERSPVPEAVTAKLRAFLADVSSLSQVSQERLDIVIALLEVALANPLKVERDQQSADPEDSALKNRLASLLVERAMLRLDVNASGAESDLNRAISICPHNHEIRRRLAILWCNLGARIGASDRFQGLEYLRRAEELILKGQVEYPGFDYSTLQDWIRDWRIRLTRPEHSKLPFLRSLQDTGLPEEELQPPAPFSDDNLPERVRLYSQGTQEMLAGHLEQALQTFDKALTMAPDDKELQASSASTVLAVAVRRIEMGRVADGLELLKQWEPRLPDSAELLRRQAEFLQSWPTLQHWLNDNPLLKYDIRSYERIVLGFDAKNIGTVMMTVRMKGTDLCLSSPLPIVGTAEVDAVLWHLLLATRELPFFKVTRSHELDLHLQGEVPLGVLDAGLFHLLLLELRDYADLSHEQVIEMERLRDWFRETRQRFVQVLNTRQYLNQSSTMIERYCDEQKLAFQRHTNARYDISAPFGQVMMEAWTDCVRLSVPVRELPYPAQRGDVLAQLTSMNNRLRWCKLTLNEEDTITLSAELPYLAMDTVTEAFELLDHQRNWVLGDLVI